MSNIDKHLLHTQQLKSFITCFLRDPAHDNNSSRSMTSEVFRIALASLEAEAVADVVAWSSPNEERTCDVRLRRHDVKPGPLYTAPPAPVSVPDEVTAEDCPAFVKYDITEVDEAWARGFNACRAAMLQGAVQPQNQQQNIPENIPFNTPCKEAPEHIWLQTAGVWPENGEFSELTWCSDNQHQDDTLYVRADVVAGNSPVIPNGWVACSERMPDSQEWVIVFAKWANQQVLCWDDVANRWTDFEDQSYFPDMFSHWMPLPAAPQQEV